MGQFVIRNPDGSGFRAAPGREELFRQVCKELELEVTETIYGPQVQIDCGHFLAGKVGTRIQEKVLSLARQRDLARAYLTPDAR